MKHPPEKLAKHRESMHTTMRRPSQQEEARLARLAYFAQLHSSAPTKKSSSTAMNKSLRSRTSELPATSSECQNQTQHLERLDSANLAQTTTDEDEELKQALALSMLPFEAQMNAKRTQNSPLTRSDHDFWSPPRYVPAASASSNKMLRLVEHVQIRDGGFAWQPATAFLDTGNQHITIIDARFAARHAIYQPDASSIFTRPDSWTTLRGVVPGASSRVPVVTIALQIHGHDFTLPVAVSELPTHDLLIGVDVLQRLFAEGFTISAGSL